MRSHTRHRTGPVTRAAWMMLASLLALALALLPGIAGAQQGQPGATARREAPPSSIWYGLSLGGAGNRLTCDVCATTRDVGTAITLAFGAYADRQLRVGVEGSRWTFDEQGARESVHALGLVAHLIPDPRRGFYLLGGAGWSGYRAGDFSYDAPRLTVGAGWDVPVYGVWTAGAVVALDAASFGALRNDDVTVARDVGMSAVRVALQLRRR